MLNRGTSSRRRRDIFEGIDEVRGDPGMPSVTLPGHAPVIRYDGPIPDLATIARTPSRRTPQRFEIFSRRFVAFGTGVSRPTTTIVLTPPIPSHGWARGLLVGVARMARPKPLVRRAAGIRSQRRA